MKAKEKMNAVVATGYGSTDVLTLEQVEKPTPKDNEILIKIHATSVSSGDARIRRADPFIIRLIFGLTKPRKSILGVVVSGEVEAIGKSVSKYKVGDQVFGSTGMSFGAHAEYVAIPDHAVLAAKPKWISYEAAAAIPFGGTASLHFLKIANIQPGQKVLVYGASGAIGTLAVQLAKHYGAEVTAVCSTSNISLVKSLGADKVIDYTKEDFSKSGEKYDVFFDTVGKSSMIKSMKSLKKGGHLLMASAGMFSMIGGFIASMIVDKKVVSGIIKETVDDMNFLKKLIEEGKVKPVIDRIYTLKQIAEAHNYVDKGHKKGNVVVSVNHIKN